MIQTLNNYSYPEKTFSSLTEVLTELGLDKVYIDEQVPKLVLILNQLIIKLLLQEMVGLLDKMEQQNLKELQSIMAII